MAPYKGEQYTDLTRVDKTLETETPSVVPRTDVYVSAHLLRNWSFCIVEGSFGIRGLGPSVDCGTQTCVEDPTTSKVQVKIGSQTEQEGQETLL